MGETGWRGRRESPPAMPVVGFSSTAVIVFVLFRLDDVRRRDDDLRTRVVVSTGGVTTTTAASRGVPLGRRAESSST